MKPETDMHLCSICKIGYESYMHDSRSPMCPYIGCNNGKTCSYFAAMDTTDFEEALPEEE